MRAIPYIQTMGSERFKNFLTVPFSIDMLAPIFGDKSCDTIFGGWRGKNMGNWYKFVADDDTVLEFYPDYYIIKKPKTSINYQMPLPKNVNDFVNDMFRFDISIYWSIWVDVNFEPKEYLDAQGVSDYFKDLLTRMGKIHEL